MPCVKGPLEPEFFFPSIFERSYRLPTHRRDGHWKLFPPSLLISRNFGDAYTLVCGMLLRVTG